MGVVEGSRPKASATASAPDLFRKLGVRNRAGALAVADAFGLLPVSSEPASV